MKKPTGLALRVVVAALALCASLTAVSNSGDGTATAAPPPSNASAFTPLAPVRLLDTRTDPTLHRLSPLSSIDVQVTGRHGVPDFATAVMVNVTAVDSGGRGYVQVIPTGGAAIGSSSTLNIDTTAQTIPNAAFAPLGAGGRLTVYATFATDIVIDVSGYFTPASASASGRLMPLTPNRILDTRVALGWTPPTPPPTTPPATTPTTPPPSTAPPGPPANPGDTKNCGDFATYASAKAWFDMYFPYYGDVAKLDQDNDGQPCETLPGGPGSATSGRTEIVAATTVITLQVAGRGGVPSLGVSAVVLNVTAVDPTGAGFVQVAPTPLTRGASSNLNTAAGRTIANLVVVPLGAGGAVDLYTTTNADLLADVVGYFTDGSAAVTSSGLFVPVTPNRQLDSRETSPAPLAGGTTTRIDINDVTTDAIALAGNLTATEAARGYVQVAGTPVNAGSSSNLNISYNGQTIANAVLSNVNAGLVDTYNLAPAHVLLDVTGWFTAG